MAGKKVLGTFQIIMINVIAVDSIRTLPFSAQYGFSLIFFYAIAALFFFIPSALVSAELGTGWPKTGGLYVWIKEAFGKKCALVVIWLNWLYNLAWYPTIMALIAGTSAYLFDPELANSKVYIVSITLLLFWLATYLNCHGMKISSIVSSVGAILGTLLPMLTIIVLGIIWLSLGYPSEISFSWENLLPNETSGPKLSFFSNVLFGLIGLEMVASHAAEMKNPKRDYPLAILISALIIIASIVFASLAIAIVVPHGELNLVVGTLQAFTLFWKAFNLSWMVPITAICIILGGLSGVSAWIIGPTKGIMVASKDGLLPSLFTKTNKENVPTGALLLQGIIVTILCIAFLLMPTVNSSFWLLSIITAQLAMIVYFLLFAACIKLHHHQSEVKRAFKIPGGDIGIWITALFGMGISLFAMAVGFIPPDNIAIKSTLYYEALLLGGMLLLILLPFALKNQKKV